MLKAVATKASGLSAFAIRGSVREGSRAHSQIFDVSQVADTDIVKPLGGANLPQEDVVARMDLEPLSTNRGVSAHKVESSVVEYSYSTERESQLAPQVATSTDGSLPRSPNPERFDHAVIEACKHQNRTTMVRLSAAEVLGAC